MHELGILVHIVRTVQKAAEENRAVRVSRISLDVGEICGAIPEYMEKQFPLAIADNPMFENCQLDINVILARGRCGRCGRVYTLKEHKGICPHCWYDDFITIEGTDLFLREIEAVSEGEEDAG